MTNNHLKVELNTICCKKVKESNMKKIKILKPAHEIPINDILNLYRKELGGKNLKKNPTAENKIIEQNKRYFNHIGVC